MEDALNIVKKGAYIFFLGIFISKLLNYGFRIIIARWLSPSEYGLFSLGLAVLSLAMVISSLGFPTGIERFVGISKENKEKVKAILKFSIYIGLFLSIISGILTFVYADEISSIFFKNPDLTLILQIFAFAIPLYVISELASSLFIGLEDPKYRLITQDIIGNVSKIVLAVILLAAGLGLKGITIAYVLSIAISMFLMLFLLKGAGYLDSIKLRRHKELLKTYFSFSWPLLSASILFTLMTWTDSLMIGYYMAEDQVGIYNAAVPIASLLLIVLTGFKGLVLPPTSRLFSKGKLDKIKEVYIKTTDWITLFAVPLLLLILFYSNEILYTLFGPAYMGAKLSLQILSLGFFVAVITGPTAQAVSMTGKSKTILIIRVISALTNIIANIILIPSYGIIGAAIATSSAIIVYNLLTATFVIRKLHFTPVSKYLPYLTIIGLASFLLIELFPIPSQSALLYALINGGVSIVIFFLLSFLLSKKIREDIYELLRFKSG